MSPTRRSPSSIPPPKKHDATPPRSPFTTSPAATPEPRHISLSDRFRGSCSAWETWWLCSEGEHGEGDEWLVAVEAERDAGEQSDLGVGGFDEALGEAGVEGGVDRVTMSADAA